MWLMSLLRMWMSLTMKFLLFFIILQKLVLFCLIHLIGFSLCCCGYTGLDHILLRVQYSTLLTSDVDTWNHYHKVIESRNMIQATNDFLNHMRKRKFHFVANSGKRQSLIIQGISYQNDSEHNALQHI